MEFDGWLSPDRSDLSHIPSPPWMSESPDPELFPFLASPDSVGALDDSCQDTDSTSITNDATTNTSGSARDAAEPAGASLTPPVHEVSSLTPLSHDDPSFQSCMRAILAKYLYTSQKREIPQHLNAVPVPLVYKDYLNYRDSLNLVQTGKMADAGYLSTCSYIRDQQCPRAEGKSQGTKQYLNSTSWDISIVDQTKRIPEGFLLKACTTFKPKPQPQEISVFKFWLVGDDVVESVREFLEKKRASKAAETAVKGTAKASAKDNDIAKHLGPCLCAILPNKAMHGAQQGRKRKLDMTAERVEEAIFEMLRTDDSFLAEAGEHSAEAEDLKQNIRQGLQVLLSGLRGRQEEEGRWPDYVFEPDFIMPVIGEVYQQAFRQKHLPGVVSEREVMAGNFDAKREIKSVLKYVEMYLLWFKGHDDCIAALQAANQNLTDRLACVEQLLVKHDPAPVREAWADKYCVQPRAYQREAIAECIARNTIVCLDTGKGKTLIAIHAIDHFLRAHPGKHALFVVPTTALVSQQARAVRRHSQVLETGGGPEQSFTVGVAELCGTEMERWTERHWKQCLFQNRVLVGTPAIFEKALITTGFLRAADLSVIVFDECHHAVGNSPMAVIMRSAVARVDAHERPRIIGLSASFINGAVTDQNVTRKREELCMLLQSNILALEGDEEQRRDFAVVSWEQSALSHDDAQAIANDFVTPLLDAIQGIQTVKDPDRMVRSGVHVLQQLGFRGFRYYMVDGLVAEAEAVAHKCVDLGGGLGAKGREVLGRISQVRAMVGERFDLVSANGAALLDDRWTSKALKLVELVRQTLAASGGQGIVFCAQNCLAHPLKFLLLQHGVCADAVAGVSHMTKARKDAALTKFRSKAIAVLVSTNAAEEGLDVPSCQFVIRFDKFSTTKSHIQGSGRARTEGAQIFYFDNDLAQEQRREHLLKHAATNPALALSDHDLLAGAPAAAIPGKYPFPPDATQDGGTVLLSNCLQILLEYCVKALGETVQLTEFLQYHTPEGAAAEELHACRVPTPTGWRDVTKAEVDAYWGGARVEGLVRRRERVQEARFVFVVVVTLRRLALLDHRNQASDLAAGRCREHCPRPAFESQINLRPKFTQDETLAPQTLEWTEGDYKGRLSQWLQARYKSSALCHYEEMAFGAQGPYVSEVTVTLPSQDPSAPFTPLTFRGQQAMSRKQDAQQAAAKEAWEQLNGGPVAQPPDNAAAPAPIVASPGWTGEDYKGKLNLWCQQSYKTANIVEYREQPRPPHGFISEVTVTIPAAELGKQGTPLTFRGQQAFGKKKDAQQAAAKEAWEQLNAQSMDGSDGVNESMASLSLAASPGWTGEDYKGKLNLWCQQSYKGTAMISYQDELHPPQGFASTAVVTLPNAPTAPMRFRGRQAFGKKKDAQQAAAKEAWEQLNKAQSSGSDANSPPASVVASPGWTGEDYKGKLNVWCQRWRGLASIRYEESMHALQGFVSTVTVTVPGTGSPLRFQGQGFGNKKSAQQSAAKEAWERRMDWTTI